MSLYQLAGPKYLTVGTIVDMGPIGHQYGRILKVEQTDYKLPNPCMVSGSIKFIMQPLNLYLIRGLDHKPESVGGYVWAFNS
jgi:hypothetical protein